MEGVAAHSQREHGITASVSCVACDARTFSPRDIVDLFPSVHCI